MRTDLFARPKRLLFAALFTSAGAAAGSKAAYVYQGHLFAALSDLNAAYAQLQAGVPDKGTSRRGDGLIRRAPSQTRAAVAAGAR